VSGEASCSAENSEKSLGGQGSARNPAGELTALPRSPSWWGLLPLPMNPPRSRPSASISALRKKYGPHSAASSNSLHFPQSVFVFVRTHLRARPPKLVLLRAYWLATARPTCRRHHNTGSCSHEVPASDHPHSMAYVYRIRNIEFAVCMALTCVH